MSRDNEEEYYTVAHYPDKLRKKMTLLQYFKNYMSEHLQKAGAGLPIREGDELARLPVLRTWFRTKTAIVLHMSNGTLQMNFFEVTVCPLVHIIILEVQSEQHFMV